MIPISAKQMVVISSILLIGLIGSVQAGDVEGNMPDTTRPVTLEKSNLTSDLWTGDQIAVGERLIAYYDTVTTGEMEAIERHVITGNAFAMVEGKHTNWGWTEYRDHHLIPELDGYMKVAFRFAFQRIDVSNDMAYVSYLFALSPRGNPNIDFGSGRATAILRKSEDGDWLVQHFHTS